MNVYLLKIISLNFKKLTIKFLGNYSHEPALKIVSFPVILHHMNCSPGRY